MDHQGSVVQVDPSATVLNNGTINVDVTTPVLQTRDFMVMGSPMDSETRGGVFTDAFLVLSHDPDSFNPEDHPNIPQGATNFLDEEGDFWSGHSGGITVGEGYIVRPQSGYMDPANTTYDMTYAQGTLNNGTVARPMVYNAANSPAGTPNIYANPYPSAMDVDQFIQDNGVGAVYFWEHLTPPSAIIPGEGLKFDMDDVSIRNFGGGVAANNDAPGNVPSNVISTGQGFAIKATSTGTVSFTNDMRLLTGNTTLRNGGTVADRLWLHVESDQYGLASNMLIGFNPGATDGLDTGWDTDRLASSVCLYSHLAEGDGQLAIQTLGAFDAGRKVPVGFSTLIGEETPFTVSLTRYEGDNLEGRAIYLYDSERNTLTDLTQGDYTFRSNKANQDRRFTVLFERDPQLGTGDIGAGDIAVYPNPTSGTLHIVGTTVGLDSIRVYDVLGRAVVQEDLGGALGHQLDMSGLGAAVYFVEITTERGKVTKKVVKK